MGDCYYTGKKEIQSSDWRVRDRYYDRETKKTSRLSGGCAMVITTGKKSSSRLSGGCAIIITTGIKKYSRLSVWRVRNNYYDRKKNNSSRLSGWCAIVITTGKKDTVVCLAGARSLLRPEKKDTVVPSPAS